MIADKRIDWRYRAESITQIRGSLIRFADYPATDLLFSVMSVMSFQHYEKVLTIKKNIDAFIHFTFGGQMKNSGLSSTNILF